MKILLVGLSAQNAAALSMLIIRRYNQHTVAELELSFDDNLRLCLPVVPQHHLDAKVMIINLGGVGMPSVSSEQLERLRTFVDGRAVLFIGQPSTIEHLTKVVKNPLVLFLVSPYSKDQMEHSLLHLFGLAKKSPTILHHQNTTQTSHTTTYFQENPKSQESAEDTPKIQTQTAPICKPKTDVSPQFLYELLNTHFPIKKLPLMHKFVDIWVSDLPVKVVVGSQTVYVNAFLNMALVSHWGRLMDSCVVASEFSGETEVMRVLPMTKREFQDLENSPLQKYPLNTLLWQMAGRMLPKTIEVDHHALLLKMRFMPNFSEDKNTPEYARALSSSCLLTPRTVDALASRVSSIGKEEINRFFLLAILSGMVDNEILQSSFVGKIESHTSNEMNQGVQKAQKTGFLGRLLSKLGFG